MASGGNPSAPTGTRPRRRTSYALLVAVAWSAALVAAGFLVPVYSSDSGSSSGEVSDGSTTLVGENGLGVVPVLAIPLVVSLLVAAALRRPSRRGHLRTAWTLTGVLAVFNLLAMLSIGVFILPVTVSLLVACAASRPSAGSA